MKELTWKLENKEIVFSKPLKKRKDGIKVWFYRNPKIEIKSADYPVCFTDSKRRKNYAWLDGFEILDVAIKKRRWWGKTYYEVINREL